MMTTMETTIFARSPLTPKSGWVSPWVEKYGTPTHSMTPVKRRAPMKETNSRPAVAGAQLFDSKTNSLFVTKANRTAQIQERTLPTPTVIPKALTNRL